MTKDPAQTNKKEISERILHGGSWLATTGYLVVSFRDRGDPGYLFDLFGFRLVRNVAFKEKE
jgi:formylglycine-generating enzyme required for sulfatase activity